jgi:hypothetical protein
MKLFFLLTVVATAAMKKCVNFSVGPEKNCFWLSQFCATRLRTMGHVWKTETERVRLLSLVAEQIENFDICHLGSLDTGLR